MLRIREAESTQTVCDLRQKIAELEVQVLLFFFFFFFFCNNELYLIVIVV